MNNLFIPLSTDVIIILPTKPSELYDVVVDFTVIGNVIAFWQADGGEAACNLFELVFGKLGEFFIERFDFVF